jgi:hypothetical protein
MNPSKLHQSGGVDTSESETVLHYYCRSIGSQVLTEPLDNELEATNSMLTLSHVKHVIAEVSSVATIDPPYTLSVPSDILYEAHEWDVPTTLLKIIPREPRKDCYATDEAWLNFGTTRCIIHARRCLPCLIQTFCQ